MTEQGTYTTKTLGMKVARNIDTMSKTKLQQKAAKRAALITKTKQAKQFFSQLKDLDKSSLTTDEKLNMILDCFIHVGNTLANMENAYIDIFDNPFNPEPRR